MNSSISCLLGLDHSLWPSCEPRPEFRGQHRREDPWEMCRDMTRARPVTSSLQRRSLAGSGLMKWYCAQVRALRRFDQRVIIGWFQWRGCIKLSPKNKRFLLFRLHQLNVNKGNGYCPLQISFNSLCFYWHRNIHQVLRRNIGLSLSVLNCVPYHLLSRKIGS